MKGEGIWSGGFECEVVCEGEDDAMKGGMMPSSYSRMNRVRE